MGGEGWEAFWTFFFFFKQNQNHNDSSVYYHFDFIKMLLDDILSLCLSVKVVFLSSH